MSVTDHSDLAGAKRRMRAAALARRATLEAAGAGDAVARRFMAEVPLAAGVTIGGYWPMRDELDPRPLLRRLHAGGHPCGLCVVGGSRRPLLFRRWRPDQALRSGGFGTSVPPESAGDIVPEVMLVPLLAFDDEGYRVGYGGGFYDRTLAASRARAAPTLAVGLAYEGQAVSFVPRDASDERLDWIITETRARRIPGSGI